MGMSLSRTEWTAEMLNDLPDDGCRYEVIDGELFVTPAPSVVHQRAVSRLFMLIAPYAVRLGLDPLVAPTAVRFSHVREVQPDVLVAPAPRDRKLLPKMKSVGTLLLAAEILSPGSRRTDRYEKRRLYQDENVRDYWIVDTDSRVIERWTPGATAPDMLPSTVEWQPLPQHAPLVIDVVQYFRDVFDE